MKITDFYVDSDVLSRKMNDIYNRSFTQRHIESFDDVYNYIIYTHGSCITDKNEEFEYISRFITKNNINLFRDLLEYDGIRNSILPNLPHDVISEYICFNIDNILIENKFETWECKWFINNIEWIHEFKKDLLKKYVIFEGISYYYRKRRCYYKINKNIIMVETDVSETRILNKMHSSIDECFFIMSIEDKNIDMIEYFAHICTDFEIYKHALIVATIKGYLQIIRYILSILTLTYNINDMELYNNLLVVSSAHNHLNLIVYFVEV